VGNVHCFRSVLFGHVWHKRRRSVVGCVIRNSRDAEGAETMTPQRKQALFYLCACIGYALCVVGVFLDAK
jgi:hypothetical protein